MSPELALQAIAAVTTAHVGGHRCQDDRWYNDHTGTHTKCPVRLHMETATAQVQRLAEQVHAAATTPRHIDAVAQGMTGLVLADLQPEDAEGWRTTARYAIEALAASLDGSEALTTRATQLAQRIGGA